MPYDSNGVATINRQRAVTGQTVQAAQVNTPFDDTQSMLSQVLLRSGVAPMTGALNMNSSKLTNVADPESATDGANKEYVDTQISTVNSAVSSNARKIETVNANRLALLADKATSFRVTGTRTITLTAAATLLANWWCEVWAVDGQVTIDPDAAETINGNATLILNAGQKAIVFCTATAFFALFIGGALAGFVIASSFGARSEQSALRSVRMASLPSCAVGQITGTGNKTYHTAESRYRYLVVPRKCFNSEDEAKAQGYRGVR